MFPHICPPEDLFLLPSIAAVIATTSDSNRMTLWNTSICNGLVCANLKTKSSHVQTRGKAKYTWEVGRVGRWRGLLSDMPNLATQALTQSTVTDILGHT